MSAVACLQNVQRAEVGMFGDLVSMSLPELLVGGVGLSLIVAAALGPFVLRAYRGHVRSMMQLGRRSAPPEAWGMASGHAQHPTATEPGGYIGDDVLQAAAMRLRWVRRATWIAFGVSTCMIIAVCAIYATSLAEWASATVAMAGAIGLPMSINVRPQGSRRLLLLAITILAMVSVIFEASGQPMVIEDMLIATLAITAFYIVTAHRRFRAVIGPTAVLVCIATFCIVAIGVAQGALSACFAGALGIAGAIGAIFLISMGAYWLAIRVVTGMAWLQEHGYLSDISLAALTGTLYLMALFVLTVLEDLLPTWSVMLILCAWALSTFAAYAMVMAHAPRLPASRSLLLLRVFSSRTAASRLLDAVQANWRYIGPQYQIGGPDLAGFNVDCYEFLKFVSGRLAELFVFDQPTRQQLLARLDRQADREGRFRVCEVFCLDNAWRQTVLELMRMSDAILLDARAFRAERGGTAFEIENLAREQVLKRVVIAGDATTDWQYLESLIVRAGGDPADCARIDGGGRDGIKRCLHALHNIGARNAAIVAPKLQDP